jgi:hypothetical protein
MNYKLAKKIEAESPKAWIEFIDTEGLNHLDEEKYLEAIKSYSEADLKAYFKKHRSFGVTFENAAAVFHSREQHLKK